MRDTRYVNISGVDLDSTIPPGYIMVCACLFPWTVIASSTLMQCSLMKSGLYAGLFLMFVCITPQKQWHEQNDGVGNGTMT